MESNFYRFQIGRFACISLLDGMMDYPIQNIYTNVSRDQVEQSLRQRHLPVDVVTTPYACLYVDTGQNHIIVDTGAGDLGSKTGCLVEALKSAGISPTAIDSVIISHAHPDHIGGILDEQGRPIYAHAYYYLWKEEWAFWFSKGASLKTSEHFIAVARRVLEPIKGRMVLVDRERDVFPGVQLISAPGHTPGHTVVKLSSEGQTLVYIGDTVLQPLHLEYPEWRSVYDIFPNKAAISKQKVFNLVAGDHSLILGYHFPPFPSLGFVTKRKDGWLWTPLASSTQ